MHQRTIGFYGMTHLGLVSAVAAAYYGYTVIGYDPDTAKIDKLNQKIYPIEEPQFCELMLAHEKQLQFTASLSLLATADMIYVAMDVPTDLHNHSDLEPIYAALQQLKPLLRATQIMIVLSQVPPGFMQAVAFAPAQLFYQVETLIFGRAIERATKPERFIVGCADPTKPLPSVYHEFLNRFHCPILTMRYESAELAKIAINLYLVSSVMTSNVLADVAWHVGADWQEIVGALRLDKRIGPQAYLNPGLGISGGNLERDMVTVQQVAARYQVRAALVNQWLEDSAYYKNWVWRCLQKTVFAIKKAPVIAILGLAYKANTHSVKNSPALALIHLLQSTPSRLHVHDPVVKEISVPGALRCDSAVEALRLADVLVIMTPWSEYANLTVQDLLSHMQSRVIIDPYRVLAHDELRSQFSVYTLGVDINNYA